MKLFRYTYLLVLAALTAVMAACSSDDDAATSTTVSEQLQDKVPVRLHLSVAGQNGMSMSNTRAWEDPNATDDEMMNIWIIVALYDNGDANDGKIAFIHAAVPAGAEREIDDLVNMTPGKYKFYSFANIDPSWLNGSGLTAYLKGANVIYDDGTMSDQFVFPIDFLTIGTVAPATPSGKKATGVYNIINEDTDYPWGGDENSTVEIDGNGFDPTAYDPNNYVDNGFGSKGIPMSNVQEIEITGSEDVDLIVVRMLAKIKLQITNTTGQEITVNSVTLSNITQNSEDTNDDNLKLLPQWTSTTGRDNMEVVQHGDLQPNLSSNAEQGDYVHTINKTIANGATETVTFYINESATPTNPDGLFYLTLKLANGSTSELRYALVNQKGKTTADDNLWNYIARNDYRIIPIVLDDLKFEIVPYDFPPIGVYPCSVKEIDADNHIYDFEFHDYGHFHLLPTVTKGGAAVEFSTTTPTGSDYKWTFIDNDWAKSWFTYTAFGDASQTENPGGFYRTSSGSTTADGDDEGQTPVWYVNDGTSGPKWAPDGANYRPFIFGYIADPEAALTSDKRVYHEMKIQVYNGSSVYRQMLYRFYMTLSADQMLGSRSLMPMPRKRH